jgi:hypothetical protein
MISKRLYQGLLFVSCLWATTGSAQLHIVRDATDVSIPIAIEDKATLAAATGLTVTTFDLYYHISGSAESAKVDATSGSTTAHSDNTVAEIGHGLYEVDWPDAIWANRTPGTIIDLTVEWDTTNHYVVTTQVQITPPANLVAILGTALPAESVAGRDAAAFGKYYDVATPAATAASVNQTGNAYAASMSMQLQSGTVATAGNARTFTLSSGFPAVANAYLPGTVLTFTDATTSQPFAGRIRSYSAGRVVTMYDNLPVVPENGDVVKVWPFLWVPMAF